MNKRFCLFVISFILFLSYPLSVYATTISELKEQKKQNEQKLSEVNETLSTLNEESKGITEEIEVLDDQLVEVIASVSLLEDEITQVEEKIATTQVELDEAIEKEETQYAAMKKRIQFMYEKGETSYVTLLLGASTISDVVNRAEYIEQLYEYDETLLIEYIDAKQAVEDKKLELELYQSELEMDKVSLEEEKAALDELLAEKKEQQEDYETKIAKAKQEAAAYKAKIKQQNSQIRKLEEEEAKKKAAALAAQQNKNNNNKNNNINASSIISSANGSATGKEIANYACKFVGNPYVYGGTSLTNGTDCSGFTQAVYKAYGYSIPRNSTAQRSVGREVSYADAEPGDIICYPGHVAIYIGNGKIVHASSAKTGIKISNALYRDILCVRRVVS